MSASNSPKRWAGPLVEPRDAPVEEPTHNEKADLHPQPIVLASLARRLRKQSESTPIDEAVRPLEETP